MKARCHTPGSSGYYKYGARGVSVHPGWRDDFQAFLDEVGLRPTPRHSLERKDNTRGYEPGNVRWATATEQARNRRTSRFLTVGDETLTMAEWSERIGLSPHNIKYRVDTLGMSAEEAFAMPKGKRGRHRLTADKLKGDTHAWVRFVNLDAEKPLR